MTTSTASNSGTAPRNEPKTEQEILLTFRSMRAELQRLAAKMGDLEAEREEHRSVPFLSTGNFLLFIIF
jgi:hypothetical protein